MLIAYVFFAGLCAVLLIMFILTYVDVLTKKFQMKEEEKTTFTLPPVSSLPPPPKFAPVNPTYGPFKLLKRHAMVPGRSVRDRCGSDPASPYTMMSKNSILPTVTTSRKLEGGSNTEFEIRDGSAFDCDTMESVIVQKDKDGTSERFLAYHNDTRCHDGTIMLSPYIAKDDSSLAGCFQIEKDPAYPSIVRLSASKRNKCSNKKKYVTWADDCSGDILLDTVDDVPTASKSEWEMQY